MSYSFPSWLTNQVQVENEVKPTKVNFFPQVKTNCYILLHLYWTNITISSLWALKVIHKKRKENLCLFSLSHVPINCIAMSILDDWFWNKEARAFLETNLSVSVHVQGLSLPINDKTHNVYFIASQCWL